MSISQDNKLNSIKAIKRDCGNVICGNVCRLFFLYLRVFTFFIRKLFFSMSLDFLNIISQSRTKSIITQKIYFCISIALFSPIQCWSVAIISSLLKNPVSRCVSRSLINMEWRDRRDYRTVALPLQTVLSTIFWKLKNPKKSLFLKTIKQKFIF